MIKTLGIIANTGKPRARDVLTRIAEAAPRHGLSLLADRATAELVEALPACSFDEMLERVDVLMAVGGDGTMLRTVRSMDGCDKPVIGLNIGSLGFLTSVAEDDLDRALSCLCSGDFVTSVRRIAECTVERNGEVLARYRALNDIVIGRGPSSRVVTLDVCVGEEEVTSFVCDGLIVSTPTGSTGHSMSAGGPILYPESSVFVVSLICPHTLSSRPLVLPDCREVSVSSGARTRTEQLLLIVDGQIDRTVAMDECVKVRRSDRSVRFIHLPEYSYFSVLRHKLNWRGSNV